MKFRKEEPKTNAVKPEGDYLLEVISGELTFSGGAKTKGLSQAELKVRFVKEGGFLYETLIVPTQSDIDRGNIEPDTLEFLENKVNTFVQSTSFPLDEGEEITAEMIADMAPALRGWARVYIDEYQGKKKNKVHFWYTDKEKFPRSIPAPQPVTAGVPTTGGDDPWE